MDTMTSPTRSRRRRPASHRSTSVTTAPWPPSVRSSREIPRKPSGRGAPPEAARSDPRTRLDLVGRDGEADVRRRRDDVAAGDGRVDADDPPAGVDERAARVARRDRRVGLDQPVEGTAALGDDRAVEGGHDARASPIGSPSRSRAKPMATTSSPSPTCLGVGEGDRRRGRPVDLQQGEVVADVRRDELGDDRLGLARQPRPGSPWPRRRRGRWSGSRRPPRPRRPCRRTCPSATSALIVTTDGPTDSATHETGRRPVRCRPRRCRAVDGSVTSARRRRRHHRRRGWLPASTPTSPASRATSPARTTTGHERRRRHRAGSAAGPEPRVQAVAARAMSTRCPSERPSAPVSGGWSQPQRSRPCRQRQDTLDAEQEEAADDEPADDVGEPVHAEVRAAGADERRSASPTPTRSPTTPPAGAVYRATTSGTSPHSATLAIT